MRCLGHHLSSNGTISHDFEQTVKSVWASFWKSYGEALKRGSDKAQRHFMRSSLQSIASFRWSRWPFQKVYAKKLDSLQRHLISCMRPTAPLTNEDASSYFRRRSLASGRVAESWGKWSLHWARDVMKWDAHITRANDKNNWAKPIRDWHAEGWLQAQRFEHSFGGTWGRTRTRSLPGHPATRWSEGVRAARAYT